MHFHTVHNHTVKLTATGCYGGPKDKHTHHNRLNKSMEYNSIKKSDSSSGSGYSCITDHCKLGAYNNERMTLHWPSFLETLYVSAIGCA